MALLSTMLCSLCVYGQNVSPVQGEQKVALSIEEMFSLADKNNHTIMSHNTAVLEAREGVKVAKNAYLPNINISRNSTDTLLSLELQCWWL